MNRIRQTPTMSCLSSRNDVVDRNSELGRLGVLADSAEVVSGQRLARRGKRWTETVAWPASRREFVTEA